MTKTSNKVGGVYLHYIDDAEDTSYSDGPIEDEILAIFKAEDADQKREEALANNPSWPMYYHLSPKRGNLLSWYNFKSGAEVLEIGAGCGAITEVLIDNNIKVDALELTEKRSLINAYRNRDAKNLNILIGNLQSYNPKKRYDYIVCVGVLEYSGMFINGRHPYSDFLKMLHGFLSKDGTLLLAIENRFGLKYWNGAKEDHTDTYFEGLSGYPGKKQVRTFGKRELMTLLESTGFSKSYFYYPFPDYKTPQIVYSDDYHPDETVSFPLSQLPTPVLDNTRHVLGLEQGMMMGLEANNLFCEFSNSFLVEVSK